MKYQKMVSFFLLTPFFLSLFVTSGLSQEISELEQKLHQSSGEKKVEILLDLAKKYNYKSPEKCIAYGREALDLSERIQFQQGRVKALIWMGFGYLRQTAHEKSIQSFLLALEISEKLKDPHLIGVSYNGLATFHNTQKNFSKALDLYQKGYEYCKEADYNPGMIAALGNIAATYGELKQYDRALEKLRLFLELSTRMGNDRFRAIALNNIGLTYKKMGKYQKSLEYLIPALKLKEKTGAVSHLSDTLRNIANSHTQLKNYDQAVFYLNRCINITREYNLKDEEYETYRTLYKLYESKGDYKTSLEYHKKFLETHQEIFNEKKLQQIQELETRYESRRKDDRIALLTKDNEIQKLRTYGLIIGLLMAFIILILLYQRYLYLFAFWKKEKYIGQYRILEKIAAGATSTVYKARSLTDKDRIVALKILHGDLLSDPSHRKRFLREAALVEKLSHPHIVQIFERGEHKNRLYMAMELLEGDTLGSFIDRSGALDLPVAFHVMIQIVSVMKILHQREILHRDLKPENIIITRSGDDSHFVKIVDFGVAKAGFQTRMTGTGILVGTAAYMPPEHIEGHETSYTGEIYSMGVIFYEMVTGSKPFVGKTSLEIMKHILESTPAAPRERRKELPETINGLIMSMMAKNPGKRPAIQKILSILENTRT